jgi:hypothetical protein
MDLIEIIHYLLVIRVASAYLKGCAFMGLDKHFRDTDRVRINLDEVNVIVFAKS